MAIVIVEIAVQLIRSGSASDDVWSILRSCASEQHIDPLVKVALLAVFPQQPASQQISADAPALHSGLEYVGVSPPKDCATDVLRHDYGREVVREWVGGSAGLSAQKLATQCYTIAEKGEWQMPTECVEQYLTQVCAALGDGSIAIGAALDTLNCATHGSRIRRSTLISQPQPP